VINALVWKDLGDGSRESAGMHPFEVLPQIGHTVEIFEPLITGKVIDIIHSSSKAMQQTEIVLQALSLQGI
jgi:hypothetical protein